MTTKTKQRSSSGRFTYRDNDLSGEMGPNIIDHQNGRVWSMALCREFADLVNANTKKPKKTKRESAVMTDKWKIKVINYVTGEVVTTLEVTSERAADQINDGLNINLNHDRYYTRIEPPPTPH